MIGTDIENIERFKNLFVNKNNILKKMFNDSEWNYAIKKANPAQTLTGIWCAKEAVLKALHCDNKIYIKDITVKHKNNGEPYIELNCNEINSETIHISISHSKEYATSVAIISKL